MSDKEQPGHIAAREELGILEKLHRNVWSAISQLSRRPNFDNETGEVDLIVHEVRQNELKGYKELADHCYGRTVIGARIDEEKNLTNPFTYRITQANIGSLDCGILSRNSPVATKLVAAQHGEEVEDNPEGTQYFKIEETRVFEGPTSLHLSHQQPDFRSMTIHQVGLSKPTLVLGLRQLVEGGVSTLDEGPKLEPRPQDLRDPTWIDDWSQIHLADSDNQSLNHQFFTQTTRAQENALNNSRGLTLVEGIAGAGKTSVALGRLKFFANFETGENREHYGLHDANESDFSPAGMVGFVLSHSLKRYLKDTATELNLERLPIRDFQEFRTHLSNRFGLSRKFRRSEAESSSYRTRLEWLRVVDAAIAQVAGRKFDDLISNEIGISAPVKKVVQDIATDLKLAKPRPKEAFHLSGIAQRVATDVVQVEYRARENSINDRQRGREFRDRFEFEKELTQSRLEEERGVITPVARQLLEILMAHDLIIEAMQLGSFSELVKIAFAESLDEDTDRALESCIDEARSAHSQKEGERLALTDTDLMVIIVSAAMIADGFEYSGAPSHLFKVRRNICVFIDEVQDFTEMEVFLMGMTASTKYHQVTLAGDLCQRLKWNGAKSYQDLFPLIPKSSQNGLVFLDRNFRQRDALALLSAGFRYVLQGDQRVEFKKDSKHPALMHLYTSRSKMVALILDRISSVHEDATVAVVVPTEHEAREWYGLLNQDLATGLRPALLARREDLTRRFEIHFTEVYETKGLEFDVVIVPDLASFELNSEIGRNQAYVAISRARHSLLLGCEAGGLNSSPVSSLVENKLIIACPIA